MNSYFFAKNGQNIFIKILNQTLNAKRLIIQGNNYLRLSAKICVLICINKDYRI